MATRGAGRLRAPDDIGETPFEPELGNASVGKCIRDREPFLYSFRVFYLGI
jgi:hypothetical protein